MPETLLIDSDVLIDHLRKENNALLYIQQEIDNESALFISVISRIEIISGARKGENETIQSLFDILTSVDVDLSIADSAGEYMREFRKSHALSIGDAVIAATAKEMRNYRGRIKLLNLFIEKPNIEKPNIEYRTSYIEKQEES